MATAFITGKIAIDVVLGFGGAKFNVHVVAKSKGVTVEGGAIAARDRRECKDYMLTVTPGSWTVHAYLENFEPQTKSIEVTAEKAGSLDFVFGKDSEAS